MGAMYTISAGYGLGEAAEKYDMQRNELIPLMDTFYGTAVELVKINFIVSLDKPW